MCHPELPSSTCCFCAEHMVIASILWVVVDHAGDIQFGYLLARERYQSFNESRTSEESCLSEAVEDG